MFFQQQIIYFQLLKLHYFTFLRLKLFLSLLKRTLQILKFTFNLLFICKFEFQFVYLGFQIHIFFFYNIVSSLIGRKLNVLGSEKLVFCFQMLQGLNLSLDLLFDQLVLILLHLILRLVQSRYSLTQLRQFQDWWIFHLGWG